MPSAIEKFNRFLVEREPIKALILYALLTVLFYAPVVFSGKTLEPALYHPNAFVGEGGGGWLDDDARRPVNSFNVDLATPVYYESPINKLIGDAYKKGQVPLWNPYQGAGTPLAAQYSTRAFFPYQIIEDVSPVGSRDFFILGRFVIAGFFTYLFLSALGLAFPAAFLGGLLYMFSGTFVWFITLEQLANTAMMLPVVMYAMELMARRRARRRTGLGAASLALMLLAGQPEVALYVTLLAFAYFLFRSVGLRQRILRSLLKFASVYALALCLAAPLIVPFLELVDEGHHVHPPGGSMGTQRLENRLSALVSLVPSATELPADPSIVRVSGRGPLVKIGEGAGGGGGDYYRFLPLNGTWDALGGYTGVVAIFLSFTALFLAFGRCHGRFRALLVFFLVFGLSVILKNLGVWPFKLLGLLPLFDQVWSLRWSGPVWTFSFAVAGAIGLEMLCKAGAEELNIETAAGGTGGAKCDGGAPPSGPITKAFVARRVAHCFDDRPWVAALIAFVIVICLIPSITTFALTAGRAEFFSANIEPFVVPSMLGAVVVALVVALGAFLSTLYVLKKGSGVYGIVALAALELWWAVPRGYGPEWLLYKWAVFLPALLAVFLFLFARSRAASGVLILVLGVFLYVDSTSPRGFPERADPFEEPPYVEFLKQRPGEFRSFYRSIGTHGLLMPNYASAVGIQDLRYVSSIVPATFHDFRFTYLHKESPPDEEPILSLWFTGRPERCRTPGPENSGTLLCEGFYSSVEDDLSHGLLAYSLLGVRYIILPLDRELEGFPLIYDKEVKVYENPAALERAFVVHEFHRAPTYRAAQAAAFNESFNEGFDPAKTAVIEEDLPGRLGLPLASKGIGAESGGSSKAFITEYSANRVVVDVEAAASGMLVLTDLYYPGWSATVNGEKRKIYRVDGLVRGVFVDKGASVVEFTYLPRSFLAGLGLSLAAFFGLVYLGGVSRRRRLARQAEGG